MLRGKNFFLSIYISPLFFKKEKKNDKISKPLVGVRLRLVTFLGGRNVTNFKPPLCGGSGGCLACPPFFNAKEKGSPLLVSLFLFIVNALTFLLFHFTPIRCRVHAILGLFERVWPLVYCNGLHRANFRHQPCANVSRGYRQHRDAI